MKLAPYSIVVVAYTHRIKHWYSPDLHGVLAYNFSHRIDHLSFGEAIPGIISPLDGTEKISPDCESALLNIGRFPLQELAGSFTVTFFMFIM